MLRGLDQKHQPGRSEREADSRVSPAACRSSHLSLQSVNLNYVAGAKGAINERAEDVLEQKKILLQKKVKDMQRNQWVEHIHEQSKWGA